MSNKLIGFYDEIHTEYKRVRLTHITGYGYVVDKIRCSIADGYVNFYLEDLNRELIAWLRSEGFSISTDFINEGNGDISVWSVRWDGM